ncbi:MAG: hypothetical protein ABIT01_13860 [Thermoanaerobaculia bacterium]
MPSNLWKPKEPRWAIATGFVAAFAFLFYVATLFVRQLNPARGTGLVFGILASVLFLLEALYPLRKKLLAKPLGNARQWIQFHIWGGLLAALFALFHEGFRIPGGTMGWLLYLLTIWVTLSGLLGVFMQKFYPVALSRNLAIEALFERIPELVAKLSAEAEKLVEGASEVLDGFYRSDVAPSLSGVSPSWSYLSDVRGGRERRLAPFARITQFLPEEEKEKLADLKTIFIEKLELDAQYSVQRALRGWLVLHVPPAAILIGLTVIHICSFLLY